MSQAFWTDIETTAINKQTGAINEQMVADKASIFLKKIGIASDQQSALVTDLITRLKERKTKIENGETAATVASTIAQWAQNAALYASPIGWFAGILIIVIALLAAFAIGALVVAAAISAQNKAIKENNQSTMDNAKANMELVDSAQEASKSIKELTDSYDDLTVAGESTYEVVQSLIEQLPNLIAKYDELEGKLGEIDYFKTDRLEFLRSQLEKGEGNQQAIIEEIQAIEKDNEEKLKTTNKIQATKGYKAALANLNMAAREGQGRGSLTYSRTLGGSGDNEEYAVDTLVKELGPEFATETDNGRGVKVSFNTVHDPENMMKYYEKLKAAETKLLSRYGDSIVNVGTFKEVQNELEKLKEAYEAAKLFQDEYSKSVREAFSAGDNKKYKDSVFGKDGLSSLEEYEKQREALIDKILEDNDNLTREQAEALLVGDEIFGKYEDARK